MTDEHNAVDPLRVALAEMRAEVDGLIAQELASLLATPAGGPPAMPEAVQAEVRPRDARPRIGRTASASDRPSRPAAAPSSLPEPLEAAARPDDAGLRLDALARRLEGRLMRPRGRGAEPRGAAQQGDSSEETRDGLNPPQSGGT